jgi:kynurenine formamidase
LRIVDLSAPITPSAPDAPELMRTLITYYNHADGAREIESTFGVPSRLLRNREGWTRELLTIGTHNSTHIDAPYHYNSVIAGSRAQTIDELPLEWFFGPGVVVDFRHKADGDAVTVGDLEEALSVAEHTLHERDIVLVRTGRDSFYGLGDYMFRGPGVTTEATYWLYDHGVRVMGIDAWGWDRPLNMEAADALEHDATGIFWAAHQADLPYCQIERLYGLDALPSSGFRVACFPLRLAAASAAPARVVAIFDQELPARDLTA